MRLFHRKVNRLYSEKEIGALFTQGYSHFIYPIKLVYLKSNLEPYNYNLLVSVSKKNIRNAVDRNLVKRRMREAFRKNSELLKETLFNRKISCNIAFIYVSKNIVTYSEIEAIILGQIKYLCKTIDRIEK